MNTIDEIALRVAEKLEPRGRTYSPDHYIEFAHTLLAELSKDAEPVVIEPPNYHDEAMGCGLEDRNIIDRYEAMRHGWDCAVDRMLEQIPEEPLFTHPLPVEAIEQRVAEAIAKMINTAGTYEASFLADNVVGGKWREYQ